MRIRKINFQEINFEYCPYPQSMYDSIKRIGLSFPIKVNIIDGQYYCKDGHKRLSIIQDLLKNEEGYQKEQMFLILYIMMEVLDLMIVGVIATCIRSFSFLKVESMKILEVYNSFEEVKLCYLVIEI